MTKTATVLVEKKTYPPCKKCGSLHVTKNGKSGNYQKFICRDCGYNSYVRLSEMQFNRMMEAESIPESIHADEVLNNGNGGSVLGITEDELRSRYDNRYKINEAIKKLKLGLFFPESEFIKFANVKAGIGYRQLLDHRDYLSFKGKAGGTVYWSHPESIKKLKEDGVLD